MNIRSNINKRLIKPEDLKRGKDLKKKGFLQVEKSKSGQVRAIQVNKECEQEEPDKDLRNRAIKAYGVDQAAKTFEKSGAKDIQAACEILNSLSGKGMSLMAISRLMISFTKEAFSDLNLNSEEANNLLLLSEEACAFITELGEARIKAYLPHTDKINKLFEGPGDKEPIKAFLKESTIANVEHVLETVPVEVINRSIPQTPEMLEISKQLNAKDLTQIGTKWETLNQFKKENQQLLHELSKEKFLIIAALAEITESILEKNQGQEARYFIKECSLEVLGRYVFKHQTNIEKYIPKNKMLRDAALKLDVGTLFELENKWETIEALSPKAQEIILHLGIAKIRNVGVENLRTFEDFANQDPRALELLPKYNAGLINFLLNNSVEGKLGISLPKDERTYKCVRADGTKNFKARCHYIDQIEKLDDVALLYLNNIETSAFENLFQQPDVKDAILRHDGRVEYFKSQLSNQQIEAIESSGGKDALAIIGLFSDGVRAWIADMEPDEIRTLLLKDSWKTSLEGMVFEDPRVLNIKRNVDKQILKELKEVGGQNLIILLALREGSYEFLKLLKDKNTVPYILESKGIETLYQIIGMEPEVHEYIGACSAKEINKVISMLDWEFNLKKNAYERATILKFRSEIDSEIDEVISSHKNGPLFFRFFALKGKTKAHWLIHRISKNNLVALMDNGPEEFERLLTLNDAQLEVVVKLSNEELAENLTSDNWFEKINNTVNREIQINTLIEQLSPEVYAKIKESIGKDGLRKLLGRGTWTVEFLNKASTGELAEIFKQSSQWDSKFSEYCMQQPIVKEFRSTLSTKKQDAIFKAGNDLMIELAFSENLVKQLVNRLADDQLAAIVGSPDPLLALKAISVCDDKAMKFLLTLSAPKIKELINIQRDDRINYFKKLLNEEQSVKNLINELSVEQIAAILKGNIVNILVRIAGKSDKLVKYITHESPETLETIFRAGRSKEWLEDCEELESKNEKINTFISALSIEQQNALLKHFTKSEIAEELEGNGKAFMQSAIPKLSPAEIEKAVTYRREFTLSISIFTYLTEEHQPYLEFEKQIGPERLKVLGEWKGLGSPNAQFARLDLFFTEPNMGTFIAKLSIESLKNVTDIVKEPGTKNLLLALNRNNNYTFLEEYPVVALRGITRDNMGDTYDDFLKNAIADPKFVYFLKNGIKQTYGDFKRIIHLYKDLGYDKLKDAIPKSEKMIEFCSRLDSEKIKICMGHWSEIEKHGKILEDVIHGLSKEELTLLANIKDGFKHLATVIKKHPEALTALNNSKAPLILLLKPNNNYQLARILIEASFVTQALLSNLDDSQLKQIISITEHESQYNLFEKLLSHKDVGIIINFLKSSFSVIDSATFQKFLEKDNAVELLEQEHRRIISSRLKKHFSRVASAPTPKETPSLRDFENAIKDFKKLFGIKRIHDIFTAPESPTRTELVHAFFSDPIIGAYMSRREFHVKERMDAFYDSVTDQFEYESKYERNITKRAKRLKIPYRSSLKSASEAGTTRQASQAIVRETQEALRRKRAAFPDQYKGIHMYNDLKKSMTMENISQVLINLEKGLNQGIKLDDGYNFIVFQATLPSHAVSCLAVFDNDSKEVKCVIGQNSWPGAHYDSLMRQELNKSQDLRTTKEPIPFISASQAIQVGGNDMNCAIYASIFNNATINALGEKNGELRKLLITHTGSLVDQNRIAQTVRDKAKEFMPFFDRKEIPISTEGGVRYEYYTKPYTDSSDPMGGRRGVILRAKWRIGAVNLEERSRQAKIFAKNYLNRHQTDKV